MCTGEVAGEFKGITLQKLPYLTCLRSNSVMLSSLMVIWFATSPLDLRAPLFGSQTETSGVELTVSRCPSTVSRTVWKRKRVNFQRIFRVSPTEKERKHTFIRVQIEYGFDSSEYGLGWLWVRFWIGSEYGFVVLLDARPRATRKAVLGQHPRLEDDRSRSVLHRCCTGLVCWS